MSKPILTPLELDIRRFLIPVLRRASLRFKIKGGQYPRTQALQAARIDRGLYKCASCELSFKQAEIVVDHIHPVVALEGDDYDWNTFINRLYVPHTGLQILCIPCHDIKSITEDNIRTAHREVKRETVKEEKKQEKINKKLAKKKKV